jgi:hypothetical protein
MSEQVTTDTPAVQSKKEVHILLDLLKTSNDHSAGTVAIVPVMSPGLYPTLDAFEIALNVASKDTPDKVFNMSFVLPVRQSTAKDARKKATRESCNALVSSVSPFYLRDIVVNIMSNICRVATKIVVKSLIDPDLISRWCETAASEMLSSKACFVCAELDLTRQAEGSLPAANASMLLDTASH